MKKKYILLASLILTTCLYAVDIANPQSYEMARRLEAGDILKKMEFDINGDGIIDPFFTVEQSNPDPIDVEASNQEGGTSSWDAYVSKPGTSLFTVNDTLEVQGESDLYQGTSLTLRTNEMFVGNISEIQKFGIVTSVIKRAKTENFKIIYAYSWETDHFKRWKLAEFLVNSPNAIFDKYLKDDKRTHVTLQNVTP